MSAKPYDQAFKFLAEHDPESPLVLLGAIEPGARRLRDVEDEGRRREMALHFVMLGSLRYNRLDLLELVGRKSMIPLEQLRESSF